MLATAAVGAVILAGVVVAVARWLPQFRAQREWIQTTPKSLKDAGERIQLIRGRQIVGGLAVVFLMAAMPGVLWFSITIGARGRKSNCNVVLHTLLAHDHAIIDTLEAAAEKPGMSAEDLAALMHQAAKATKDLDARTRKIMEGCHG